MAYKTCENCGTKLGKHGCPNCDEMEYISMQEDYVPPQPAAIPLHKEETPAHQTGVKEEAENIVEKWKQDAIKHLGFSNFIKGNYTNECLLCKELFHNGDKKQLVCEKCCESINNNFHLESIKCPVCGKIQEAKVEHTIPFPTFIHDCIECEYTIMESEWDKVSTPAHQTGAKEKAKAIVNEFYQPLGLLACNISSNKMWDYAKERALYHVDEIIKVVAGHWDATTPLVLNEWQQVRNEISNL